MSSLTSESTETASLKLNQLSNERKPLAPHVQQLINRLAMPKKKDSPTSSGSDDLASNASSGVHQNYHHHQTPVVAQHRASTPADVVSAELKAEAKKVS